ncbi:hypothetical protein ABZ208_04970 [Streptomyces sp. NPDC006208]|uniref:hypothetical protein n=1 Tax=Streptomyces sp. NPDC006208 TaxID=3156734 RepID=UPI00339DD17E
MKKRVIAVCGGLLVVTGVATAAWWSWFRPPCSLADSPTVDVTVQAEKSEHPDVADTAADVDTPVRAYVQRLKARDANRLAEPSGPACHEPGPMAGTYMREYGEAAAGRAEVAVGHRPFPTSTRYG